MKARPVFLLGDGCDGYIEDILPVIQFLRAEIIASAHSPGLLDARTPNYRGVFGFGGHHTATQLLREPDVDSIVPATVNSSPGVVVPIPTLPSAAMRMRLRLSVPKSRYPVSLFQSTAFLDSSEGGDS